MHKRNNPRESKSPHTRQDRRRGIAQIELAAFLPLFGLLLVSFFSVSGLGRSSLRNLNDARVTAASSQQRFGRQTDLEPNSHPGSDLLGVVLGRQQEPQRGLVVGRSRSNSEEYRILTDPWDYRVLNFQTPESRVPLTLDNRSLAFGMTSRDKFSELLTGIVSAEYGGQQLHAEYQRRFEAALSQINQLAAALQKEISSIDVLLQSLQKQLDAELKKKRPNQALIRSLNSRISAAVQRRSSLQQQFGQLMDTRGVLNPPQPPPIPLR